MSHTVSAEQRSWVEDHRATSFVPVAAGDIIGLDHILDEIGSLVARLRHPEIVLNAGGDLPRGVLLFGGPGLGKTLTARYLATCLGSHVPFYQFSADELSADRIRDVFATLADHQRCVLFVDEIDGFARDRKDASHTPETRASLTAMLTELDGLGNASGILLVATSNTHWVWLDDALLRPGRIGFRFEFGDPDEEARLALFEYYAARYANGMSGDFDFRRFARVTRGSSPAAIKSFFDDALGIALKDTPQRVTITQTDLRAAVERKGNIVIPPKIDPDQFRRTAIHEAGHVATTVAFRGIERVYSVQVNSDSSGLTWTDLDGVLERHITNQTAHHEVVIAFGGSAAEAAFYDGEYSFGSHNDHMVATQILGKIIAMGLEEKLGLMSAEMLKDLNLVGPAFLSRVDAAMKERLAECLERAKAIAAAYREPIACLADVLLDEREISGPRLLETLRTCGFDRIVSPEGPIRDLPRGGSAQLTVE